MIRTWIIIISLLIAAAASAVEWTSPQLKRGQTKDTDLVMVYRNDSGARTIPVSVITAKAVAAAPVQSVAGKIGAISLTTADIGDYVPQVNADWLAGSGVAMILNKPVFVRGFDGREVELQVTATAIQWRYMTTPPSTWTDLVQLLSIKGSDGLNGKTYSCFIASGVQTLTYDKNGSNPAPTIVPFTAEFRVDGSVVTPDGYFWSVPSTGSLLSGSASGSTFTPTVGGTYSAGAADNRVLVVLTYNGITCQAVAPVAVTKIGADGLAATPDNKQQLLAKLGVGTTGDVLNTQCGVGDAATFASRTERVGSGNIHSAFQCGGSTWYYAQPGDTATTPKFGFKNSAGTTINQFNADGSFTGTLVIK